jgi:hypothetical protein
MTFNLTIDETQIPKTLEKPKRMLGLSKLADGRDLVEINFSSLSVINDCLRKSQYSLIRGLRSNHESEALTSGKAIHKALEHWYRLPAHLRQLTKEEAELADTLIASPLLHPSEPYETALDSINAYVVAAEPLKWLGAEDKRSLNNGIKILKAYFKHYADDGLEVLNDKFGIPYVEREVEFQIWEDGKKVIRFHGSIDIILRSTISGQIFVADHKTTASLGSQFYNRVKPNHQYTGYIWAARECLGIETDSFLVNGIQVAKTKSEFARQPTTRNQEDFEELRMAMVEASERILKAKEYNLFPMNAPAACNAYGACQFYEVCSSPKKLRETIISAKYEEGEVKC